MDTTMIETGSAPTTTASRCSDAEYGAYVRRVNDRFRVNCAQRADLFTTDAPDLFAVYLEALPAVDRQYHMCRACQDFFRRYGGLATIDAQGRVESAIWNVADAPAYYAPAVARLAEAVAASAVTGVFRASETTWGTAQTTRGKRPWHHLAVTPLAPQVHRGLTQTADRAAAEKREDFKNVARALGEYTPVMLEQALTLLRSEALYRSEHVLGQAEWLATLHTDRAKVNGPARDNLLWRAVARAPAGFCHPRASMIGTLLDDLAGGMAFDDVARRFADKMHPLRYQRPQAAPAAGTIAQAEKIFAQLQAAGALARRYARLDDVAEKVWTPRVPTPPGEGLFAHLKPRGPKTEPLVVTGARRITWVKFLETVLPTAERIDCYLPSGPLPIATLLTATDPEAPPILQWDRAEARNPVSWYYWHGGAPAAQYGLATGWCPVSAVTYLPSMWGGDPLPHHGESVLLMLEGAHETRNVGLALFPECLRSELHGIRSVIEAHSRSAQATGIAEAGASGMGLKKGAAWDCRVRVVTGAAVFEYVLERWD